MAVHPRGVDLGGFPASACRMQQTGIVGDPARASAERGKDTAGDQDPRGD